MVIDASSKSTHRLDGPEGVLCHPDRHGAIISSLRDLGHWQRSSEEYSQNRGSIYRVVTAVKIIQQGQRALLVRGMLFSRILSIVS